MVDADRSAELAERVRAATGPLRIRGGGSKDFYGNPLAGEVLDVAGHRGIVAYEPSELFITARCGTPLTELEAALAASGQMLACEPPRFTEHTTVGGAVASGLSGPRRSSAGAVRDFVLGVRLLDGRGRLLSFGGQVMKNVAGYDVSRLVAGSLGTLGVILEVSLKVLPLPAAQTTRRFEMSEAQAIDTLNRWAGRPLPISASAWQAGVLSLRLSGARAAVAAAAQTLGGEALDDAAATDDWNSLRDQRNEFFAGLRPLWRIALPGTTPPLDLPGATLIEWLGGQRWLRGDFEAATMRERIAAVGGHVTLFRGGDKSEGVFHPLPAPLAELNRRVREALDERGTFATGRL
jgi:glycolate oxidase FAD binding subunit